MDKIASVFLLLLIAALAQAEPTLGGASVHAAELMNICPRIPPARP